MAFDYRVELSCTHESSIYFGAATGHYKCNFNGQAAYDCGDTDQFSISDKIEDCINDKLTYTIRFFKNKDTFYFLTYYSLYINSDQGDGEDRRKVMKEGLLDLTQEVFNNVQIQEAIGNKNIFLLVFNFYFYLF